MSSYLDIRTLSALTGFVNLIICIIMLYVYRTRKTYPGFSQWVSAAFLLFFGTLLLSMRKMSPDLLTVILANELIACSFVMITYGIHIFYEKKVQLWHYIAPVVLMLPPFIFFTYFNPNVGARIVIITLLATMCLAISAYSVHTESRKVLYGTNILVVGTLAIQSLYFLVRIIYTITIDKGIQDFMSASAFQSMTFLLLIGGNTSLFLGFIILNSQRVEHALLEANKEIKHLRGIFPICAHCKKIRDDTGFWNQIEAYIEQHSDAEFSHSICQECAKKYYPDMDIYND